MAPPDAARRVLPVLDPPPGHPAVAHLSPPSTADDVVNRETAPLRWLDVRTLRAFAEALFHTAEGPADPSRIAWLVEDYVAFVRVASGNARAVQSLCLFALARLAPLVAGRFSRFAALDVATRVQVLERFEATPFGPAALGVKAILCMIWFEHPDTMRETRTEPTCLLGGAS